MNTERLKELAITSAKGAAFAAIMAIAQDLLNGKAVGGKKVVLFTAQK